MKNIKILIVTVLLFMFTNFTFGSAPLSTNKKSFENKISYLLNLNAISREQKVGSEVAVKVQLVDHKLQILNISGNNSEFENYIVMKIHEIEIKDAQNFTANSFIIRIKLL